MRWLEEGGLDGVFVGGTTGEGVLLESDEVEALTQRAVSAARLAARDRADRPAEHARDVRLVRARRWPRARTRVAAYVPWFYPITQVQVRTHFLAVLGGRRRERRRFLYNIPPRTVNDLEPALAGEARARGVRGMKDSTGDLAPPPGGTWRRSGSDSEFEVYTGTEPLIAASVRAGAIGSINALSNCRPELFVALRDALEAGDEAAAGRAQDEISGLKEYVRAEESTVAAVKRRVRDRLADRGVDYPTGPRAPFA